MTVAALDLGSGADLRFFLEFTEAGGTRRQDPLASCVTARLEDALPVRSFQWAKGASHFPGLWWSSTTGDHVGFESWLERDHVMAMDFDPDITASPPSRSGCTGATRTAGTGGMRRTSSPGGLTAAAWWSTSARMTGSRRRTPGCS